MSDSSVYTLILSSITSHYSLPFHSSNFDHFLLNILLIIDINCEFKHTHTYTHTVLGFAMRYMPRTIEEEEMLDGMFKVRTRTYTLSCTYVSRIYCTCWGIFCPVLSCPVLSCPVLSCPILSYLHYPCMSLIHVLFTTSSFFLHLFPSVYFSYSTIPLFSD